MPGPKKYPDELRERAVRLVFDSQRPIAAVARDLGVHKEALRLWVRQAEADPGSRQDRLTTVEREELARLRAARSSSCARPTRSSRPRRCFSPASSTRPTEVSAFVAERRTDFGVELICQTLGVSASAYYQARPASGPRASSRTSGCWT